MTSYSIDINTSIEDKNKIYDIIELCKINFSHFKKYGNYEDNFSRILKILHLDFSFLKNITIDSVYCFLTQEKRCLTCNKLIIKKQIWPNRMYNNETKCCSTSCSAQYRAKNKLGWNQNGINKNQNLIKSASNKQSLTMKKKIADGLWTPAVTNSWAGSKCCLSLNNKFIFYRSSWEAFFHLCNQNLKYEKLIIQYVFQNEEKNYITDFVDLDKKIIYEIKPASELNSMKNARSGVNKAKFEYAIEWCKDNGYKFKIISDNWYINNFNKFKHLLNEQQDKEIILKRLKQFNNEN